MVAAWTWIRWKISSSAAAHGGNAGEPTDGGRTITYTTTTGTTCTTTRSGPVRQRSFDFRPLNIIQPPSAPVVEEIADEEERAKKLKHINALVQRFSSGEDRAPAEIEKWLSELEVTWVLHVDHGSERSGRSFISGQLLYLALSWIRALFEITRVVSAFFCCREYMGVPPAAASKFILFVESTLSKMLPFVDAIVAVGTCLPNNHKRRGAGEEPADEKLQALILLRDAISTASVQILSSCSQDLLSAEQLMAKLDEATWNTMEEIKAGFMEGSPWWWGTPISSAIHPFTRSFISYVEVLWVNHGSVNRILDDAFHHGQFVPPNENASHLTNLTLKMAYSLEEKLARSSQSFTDQSLKFLFLINNCHYLLQQLGTNFALGLPMPEIAAKIDDYINSYIQLYWAPVLEYLPYNPTPHCFTRRTPLQKFESKFHETYNAQKLWKVPDPEMRKKLREAIVQEVIPGFTEFFKDNTVGTPRITPQVMMEMLQELFEG